MNKDKKATEIDPEELLRRKFRAKCRFRAVVRMVIANNYWMSEAVEEYEGFDDVKRRVEQAVRAKSKKKQLLNINDKALLNKSAEDRNDHEKKYIYRIIGGLKCFKRYPDYVKRKLAAVTYFKYYGHNRVIVRQNQEAHAMYFIVTGDVIVSALVYDELLQKQVSIELGQMHTGDMFGEVSLLHNIKRTATCTTSGNCEFLALMKEDFKNVLQASLQKQWDEIRQAMSSFSYFDSLDEVAKREGCIVAKMKSFNPDETILGDGRGVSNYVYFVLSGNCQMIESLQIDVTKNAVGKEFYSLHDPFVENTEEDEIDFDKKYFSNTSQENQAPTSDGSRGTSKRAISTVPRQSRQSILKIQPSTFSKLKFSSSAKLRGHSHVTSEGNSTVNVASLKSRSKFISPISSTQDHHHKFDVTIDESRQSKTWFQSSNREPRESIRYDIIPNTVRQQPSNRQTYFMQVCIFNPGSTFGFGENMRDRRIIALTRVDCMLLPLMWLMQRNTVNIWSRIAHYLSKKIPTKQQLFEEFVKQRRWKAYRGKVVSEVVSHVNGVNHTTISDVPYSIRIENMLDY